MKLTRTKRLSIAIAISSIFFVVELSAGFYTHSVALIADAFHYLNDLISFGVALAAVIISGSTNRPGRKDLSFGWQRAQLLGSFFNGVFLLALGVSILLQSIERFVSLQKVSDPVMMLVIGCVGLTLNIISAAFLHEHDHGPSQTALENLATSAGDDALAGSGIDLNEMPPSSSHHEHRHKVSVSKHHHHCHDLGMAAILLHVLSDALNNLAVIAAACIIRFTRSRGRFYADAGASLFITLAILCTALPLVRHAGQILLQSPPPGIDVADIQHDLERVAGVLSVHELHVWRLNQHKAIATGHVVVADPDLRTFQARQAKTIIECLHAYGVHSATLQPELLVSRATELSEGEDGASATTAAVRRRLRAGDAPLPVCALNCGVSCELLSCCG